VKTENELLTSIRQENPALASAVDRALAALRIRSEELADTLAETIQTVAHLDPQEMVELAEAAVSLGSGGWKSLRFAREYLEVAGELVECLGFAELRRLTRVLSVVQQQSVEIATSCFALARTRLLSLGAEHRSLFLDLAEIIVRRGRPDAVRFFEAGAEICGTLDGAGLGDVVTAIIAAEFDEPYPLLSDIVAALREVDEPQRAALLTGSLEISGKDPQAAGVFLKSAPRLVQRLDAEAITAFARQGLDECRDETQLKGFFSLRSPGARAALAVLSGGIALAEVSGFLAGFAQALCGEEIDLGAPREDWSRIAPQGSRTGRLHRSVIYLPEYLDAFETREMNLAAYKMLVARQAGRAEFGSYAFEFGRAGVCLPSTLEARESRPSPVLVAMQRFFDLFPVRALIVDLFRVVEDLRVETYIQSEYPGLIEGLEWLAQTEATSIEPAATLQDAYVDGVRLAALGHAAKIRWPKEKQDVMLRAIGVLNMAKQAGASVQDSAEIAAWLCDVGASVPRTPLDSETLDFLDPDLIQPLTELPALPETTDQAISSAYQGRTSVDRGDFMPELSQAIDRLVDAPVVDLEDLELLKELLARSVEVEADAIDAGDLVDVIEGFFGSEQPQDTPTEDVAVSEPAATYAYYDEWDFRQSDYLASWCRVGEKRAPEGGIEFCHQVLEENRLLVHEIRRQFELMKPESHRRIRNLDDGPEFDLEKAVQFVVDRKAGVGPRARFYERRDKVERSVAVGLLVDVSASTSELVSSSDPTSMADATDPGALVPERIIDVERQAVVFFIEALESIGDDYGVYCFSGYGRRNVDFQVVKELEEPMRDTIYRRIDGTDAARGTRMGAAIRHASFKLASHPAKVRLLLILSDGRPEDQGYGLDASDRDYGLFDTRKALMECKTVGVVPFLITIDREGEDYLEPLCRDIGYEVIDRVAALPTRLPEVYRHLTC
jgi:hypothetical protein